MGTRGARTRTIMTAQAIVQHWEQIPPQSGEAPHFPRGGCDATDRRCWGECWPDADIAMATCVVVAAGDDLLPSRGAERAHCGCPGSDGAFPVHRHADTDSSDRPHTCCLWDPFGLSGTRHPTHHPKFIWNRHRSRTQRSRTCESAGTRRGTRQHTDRDCKCDGSHQRGCDRPRRPSAP